MACLFWILCLTLTAAGHRLYKSLVKWDRNVSQARYNDEGATTATWVGHGTVEAAYSKITAPKPDTGKHELRTLPNSAFWLTVTFGLTVLAGLLAWSGRFVNHNGIQSLIGLFAGHFLWLGAVEFGLDAVGRRLGLCGALDVVNGRVVGTHGGGILIQMSAIFLVPVLIGLALHESNRCALFEWFRKRIPLTRSVSATGRVDNYAARTTIQYFLTVWFCYVTVLWCADPMWGHLGGVFLMVAGAGIVIATPYMIWRTTKQSGVGQSLRYSVSGAVVTWTAVEIAASMRLFREPWLSSSTSSGVIFLTLTVVLTALVLSRFVKKSPGSFEPSRSMANIVVLLACVGLAGCSNSMDAQIGTNPDEIAERLREFNERIVAPDAAATDGLLHALASNDPESAAQAAVAFGKRKRVSPAVTTQLKALAVSDKSRLSQFAALQALSRLGQVTPDIQRVIDELAGENEWQQLVEYSAK